MLRDPLNDMRIFLQQVLVPLRRRIPDKGQELLHIMELSLIDRIHIFLPEFGNFMDLRKHLVQILLVDPIQDARLN